MRELPTKAVPKTKINPGRIIIFGNPKIGKTTLLSKLPNCLILDMEDGSEYLDAMKINVKALSIKEDKPAIVILKEIIDSIRNENEKLGGYKYKFIAVDTIGALDDATLLLANKLYRQTPMGKNWDGDDVTLLPKGAGYRFTRAALTMVLDELEELCETLIIMGHVKDKLLEKDGKEFEQRELDLPGKMPSILCSHADTVGYMYREDNLTKINFKANEDLICGGRSKHLINKVVTVLTSDPVTNEVTADWSEIFINNNK